MLQRLKYNRLMAKSSKCQWRHNKIEYLGHVLGEGRVEVPEARVMAIYNFKKPTIKKDFSGDHWIL